MDTKTRHKQFFEALFPRFGNVSIDQSLFLVFLALQILGYIQWSWLAVFSPLCVSTFVYFLMCMSAMGIYINGKDFPFFQNTNKNFSLPILSTLMFIAFKLSGVMTCSWWMVFSPMFLTLGIFFTMFVFGVLFIVAVDE